jgi:hypothetical protein
VVIPQLQNEPMSDIVQSVQEESSTKPRGTSLLEIYENCLPNFDSLDEEQHLKFVKAIRLISDQLR